MGWIHCDNISSLAGHTCWVHTCLQICKVPPISVAAYTAKVYYVFGAAHRSGTSLGCPRPQQRLASSNKLSPRRSARPRLFRATNPLQPLHTLALCRTLTRKGPRQWNSSFTTTTLNAASKAQSESGYNRDRSSQISSQ